MANKPEIAVKISAVDQYSSVMLNFRKQLEDIQRPITRMQKDFADRSRFAGIDRLNEGMGAIRERATAAGASIAGLAPGLGMLSGIGTVAGIGRMVVDFASFGTELTNVARLSGMSARELNSLRGAATMTGVSTSSLDQSMLGLQNTVSDAFYGKNATAAQWFNRLHISIGSAATGAARAGDVYRQLAPVIANMAKTNPHAAAALLQVFAMNRDTLPMYVRGIHALDDMRRSADRLTGSRDDLGASSQRLTEAEGRVTLAARGLRDELVMQSEPAITGMLTGMTKWIEQNTRTKESIDALSASAVALAGTALFRLLFGARATGAVLGAATSPLGVAALLPATLSGDTPGAGRRPPLTGSPEDVAQQMEDRRRIDQATNTRYGYTGSFWHDLGHWLSGGAARDAAQSQAPPSGPPRAIGQYKPVLDLIGRAEGTDRGRGYREAYDYGRYGGGRDVDITRMTLNQIDGLQTQMLANETAARAAGQHVPYLSTALGRYQFNQPTLQILRARDHLTGSEIYNPAMQDRLAAERIQMQGGLTASNLSQIWASLPDPATGGSFYGQPVGATGAEVAAAIRQAQAPATSGQPDQSPPLVPALTPLVRPNVADRNSTSTVRIHLTGDNLPRGMGVKTATDGDGVEMSSIRLREAMQN